MRYLYGVIVIACLLRTAGATQDDTFKKELDSLQGVWQCVSFEEKGKALPEEQVKGLKLTFKGYKASHAGKDGKAEQATIKIDPLKKPKTIDMILLGGPDKGKTVQGIYVIEGDTLTICGSQAGRERPTEFKGGKEVNLMVFKRDKR